MGLKWQIIIALLIFFWRNLQCQGQGISSNEHLKSTKALNSGHCRGLCEREPVESTRCLYAVD